MVFSITKTATTNDAGPLPFPDSSMHPDPELTGYKSYYMHPVRPTIALLVFSTDSHTSSLTFPHRHTAGMTSLSSFLLTKMDDFFQNRKISKTLYYPR